MELGTPELILILVIVVMLFGVGRIGKVGKELGQGMRSFREGLHDPLEENAKKAPQEIAQPVNSVLDREDKSTL